MSQIRCFHGNAECRACGIEPEWTAENERADVVAWLREWQNTMDDRITHDDLDYAIAVIERGEHRRTEEE